MRQSVFPLVSHTVAERWAAHLLNE